jgi:hypothetical protein
MSNIGAGELISYTDKKGNIYSGGFSLNNILKKMGQSPIITLNKNKTGGGERVSDLFNDLAIPAHALYLKSEGGGNTFNYDNSGIIYNNVDNDDDNNSYSDDEENDNEQEGGNLISDDLYNKLLALVSVDINGNEIQEHKQKKQSKRFLKNKNKKTRKHKK